MDFLSTFILCMYPRMLAYLFVFYKFVKFCVKPRFDLGSPPFFGRIVVLYVIRDKRGYLDAT